MNHTRSVKSGVKAFQHRLLDWSTILACASLLWAGTVQAQIVRDGSLGQTPGALSGPNYTIGVQNAGTQISGNNLFHSFSQFNVNTGQTATFMGPSSIANIINRVTGSTSSNIDGTISSKAAMPNANFFLINPNGLVLGPHASLNVGGSVYLSTADYVRMSDGAQFFASLAKQSTLASAPVTAFGFLSANPAALAVRGSDLAVSTGRSLTFIGGNGTFPDPQNPGASVPPGVTIVGGRLSAPSGKDLSNLSNIFTGVSSVNIVSVASPGEVVMDPTTGQVTSSSVNGFSALGRVTLSNGVEVSADDPIGFSTGGSITALGSDIRLADVKLHSLSSSSGGVITLKSSAGIKLERSALSVSGASFGGGFPGSMILTGGSYVSMSNTILDGTYGSGMSGDINISAPAISIQQGTLRSDNFGLGSGAPGSITFNARSIDTTNTLISARSTGGQGVAGFHHAQSLAKPITLQGLQGPGSKADSVSLNQTTITTAANFDLSAPIRIAGNTIRYQVALSRAGLEAQEW